MTARLVWQRDGRDWPNREASQFIHAAGFCWHVQRAGTGQTILLLHGSGASTHSWEGLFPLLAQHFDVIAPDLPGQGFSQEPPARAFSLPGMAQAVADLLRKLDVAPQIIIGHSAGAAVAVRMSLDKLCAPRAIIGVNAALLPFEDLTGPIYAGMAKLLAMNPLVPWAFANLARRGATVERLIQETGSRISDRGLALYGRLAGTTSHVAATLRMMANWNLGELERDLPKLQTPLHLITGSRDRTIAPARALEICKRVPHCDVISLPGLGHLAHEEQPALLAEHILRLMTAHGVTGAAHE